VGLHKSEVAEIKKEILKKFLRFLQKSPPAAVRMTAAGGFRRVLRL
jgi:hypothetical protein